MTITRVVVIGMVGSLLGVFATAVLVGLMWVFCHSILWAGEHFGYFGGFGVLIAWIAVPTAAGLFFDFMSEEGS